MPLAYAVGLSNILTAYAAVFALFTLIQFSTGGAVEALIGRIVRAIREALAELREGQRQNREAIAANTAALVQVNTSLRWLASQFDHGVGELRTAAVDTTDTIAIVSQTVAQVGDALAATQKVIAEGITGLRQDIVGQRRGRGSGQRPRRGGGPPRQPQGGSTAKGSVPIDETFKAYLAGVRAREEGQHGGGPPPVA